MKNNSFMIVSIIAFFITIGLVTSLFFVNKPVKKEVDNRISVSFEDKLVCTKIALDFKTECVENTIKLSQEDIDGYSAFNIRGNVTSLKGLENFKNIKTISVLNASNLKDISSIKNMKLVSFTMSSDNGSKVSFDDVSDLAIINSLKTINISHTSVTDVSVLVSLNNLEALVIDDTNIVDVSMLNNGKLKVAKNGLVFNTNNRQAFDSVLASSVGSYKELVIDGPCRVDSSNRLASGSGEGTTCRITTPDGFLTLNYNLVSE